MRFSSGTAIVMGVLFLFSGCKQAVETERLCVRDMCYSIEIAKTPEARAQGLMFRKELPPQTGMLFVFDQPDFYPFWMKNTLIPLDILWLDADKRVVHIESEAPPCNTYPCPTYASEKPAMYVLEIPAGDADRGDIRKGEIFR